MSKLLPPPTQTQPRSKLVLTCSRIAADFPELPLPVGFPRHTQVPQALWDSVCPKRRGRAGSMPPHLPLLRSPPCPPACPLLGFPPLRLSQRKALRRPKLHPRRPVPNCLLASGSHPPASKLVEVSLSWKPKLALSLVLKASAAPAPVSRVPWAWAGAGWQELGAPAALTPVVGALGRSGPQQLAAAIATGARQGRKELNARPSNLTRPLPPPPHPLLLLPLRRRLLRVPAGSAAGRWCPGRFAPRLGRKEQGSRPGSAPGWRSNRGTPERRHDPRLRPGARHSSPAATWGTRCTARNRSCTTR